MKALILIASILAAAPAFATVGPALIDEMNDQQATLVEAKINRALLKQTGFKALKDLRVDWNKARCLEANSEMNSNTRLGVCILAVGAFRLEGAVAMIKTPMGYEIKVIYANVE